MKTVADQLAEILAAVGVKRIYGVVGDSLNGLTDAIRRQGKIEWVHVRNEEAGAFAAGAEAHLTGELAVCAGSCGPGNLHLINGLFDCHRSRVPVLGIVAQIPSSEIGSGYFQETHPQNLFQECSHYCELVSGANQMARVGACWLVKKCEGDVRDEAYRLIPRLAVGLLAFLIVVFAYALMENLHVMDHWFERPVLLVFPVIGVIAVTVVAHSVRHRHDDRPFTMVALTFAAAFGTLAISFWPYMIPFSITIDEAAAPHASLAFMFWGAGLFVFPLMLIYAAVNYFVFRAARCAGHNIIEGSQMDTSAIYHDSTPREGIPDNAEFLASLRAIVGPRHVLTNPQSTRRYRTGFRFGSGPALAVVRPGTLVEQWKVLKACAGANKIILMQAANTGITGGSTPDGSDYDRDIVIISTTRMAKIRLIKDGQQVICHPGATLDFHAAFSDAGFALCVLRDAPCGAPQDEGFS